MIQQLSDIEFYLELFKSKSLELINRTPKNDSTMKMKDASYNYLSQTMIQVLLNLAIKDAAKYVHEIMPIEDKDNFIFSAHNISSSENKVEYSEQNKLFFFESTFSVVFNAFSIREKIHIQSTFTGTPTCMSIPMEILDSGMAKTGYFVKTLGSIMTYSHRYGARAALSMCGCEKDDLEFIHEQNRARAEYKKQDAILKQKEAFVKQNDALKNSQ